MSKKDFGDNLRPKKTAARKKPTDEEINKALKNDKKRPKEKMVRFAIRMPESIFNELDEAARSIGVSKKSIMMQGLTVELRRLNQK